GPGGGEACLPESEAAPVAGSPVAAVVEADDREAGWQGDLPLVLAHSAPACGFQRALVPRGSRRNSPNTPSLNTPSSRTSRSGGRNVARAHCSPSGDSSQAATCSGASCPVSPLTVTASRASRAR